MMTRLFVFLLMVMCLSSRVYGQATSKPVSRALLIHYISKGVQATALNDYCKTSDGWYPGDTSATALIVDENELLQTPVAQRELLFQAEMKNGRLFQRYLGILGLIRNVKPKLITDALTIWGGGTAWPPWQMNWKVYVNRCTHIVKDIKAIDTDIVVQAAINEYVDPALLNAIGGIPEWVFTAFDLPVQTRKFDLQAMIFADYKSNETHRWTYSDGIVPDISRIEAQMLFYYMSVMYINAGCESLQYCQVELMNNQSTDPAHWGSLIRRVRKYADRRHDIRFLLVTGGTQGMRYPDGKLILDYNSSPIRPSENGYDRNVNGGGCYIDAVQCWDGKGKLYRGCLGGITPSGWSCDELPGIVLFDNWGPDPKIGGQPGGPGCNQYNWDEITWYALQDRAYRNSWLRYAADRVRYLDTNIFLVSPVRRIAVCSTNDVTTVEYLANNPTADTLFSEPATIGNIPGGLIDRNRVQLFAGYGQEDVIKELMADAGHGGRYTATVSTYPNPVTDWLYFRITANAYTSLRLLCDIANAMGQKVLRSFLMDAPMHKMNVSNLSPGIYFITVYDEDQNLIYSNRLWKR